jgi:hypothetical protein
MAKPKPYEPPVCQLLALGDPREGDEFGQPPDKWLDCRAACAGQLVERLAQGRWNDPTLNGFIVAQLLELRAVEAAPIIEKAFALRQVDPSIVGGWEDVRQELKGEVELHE